VNDKERKDELYLKGLEAYHQGKYNDAHEFWEDLWCHYYLKDKIFIQGLIMLTVSFAHLQYGNLSGAKGLIKKCQVKFADYKGIHRNINVNILMKEIRTVEEYYNTIENTSEFNWDLVPELVK
jgi:predicted metal-dependent hydrolase